MPTITNVFLDFDNTQFDGHLHNILSNYVKQYKDNEINGLSAERLKAEFTGERPISSYSEIAIEMGIYLYKTDAKLNMQKKKLDFFDAKKLNEVVGVLKREGVNVMVVTSSDYPNAINTLYKIKNLGNLQDIRIIKCSVTPDIQQRAKDKIEKIAEIEKEFSIEEDRVINFFVDDSEENIKAFNESRNKGNNIGFHASEGMDTAFLEAFQDFILKEIKRNKQFTDLAVSTKNEQKNSESISDLTPSTDSKEKKSAGILQRLKNVRILSSKDKYAVPVSSSESMKSEDLSAMVKPINREQENTESATFIPEAQTQSQSRTDGITKGAIPKTKTDPTTARKPPKY